MFRSFALAAVGFISLSTTVDSASLGACTEGDAWMVSCNHCTCRHGLPSCTNEPCGAEAAILSQARPKRAGPSVVVVEIGHANCLPGQEWKEDCNTCLCGQRGVTTCTRKPCPRPPWPGGPGASRPQPGFQQPGMYRPGFQQPGMLQPGSSMSGFQPGSSNQQGGFRPGVPSQQPGGFQPGSSNQQGGFQPGAPSSQQGGFKPGVPSQQPGGFQPGVPNPQPGGFQPGVPGPPPGPSRPGPVQPKPSEGTDDIHHPDESQCVPGSKWEEDCNSCFCTKEGETACTIKDCTSESPFDSR